MDYSEQLKTIISAAKWSQEELAHQLSVSFPTLNSWINKRSYPRKNALVVINNLYLQIVGVIDVDEKSLALTKAHTLTLKSTAKNLLQDKDALNKLTLYLTYHTNTIEGSTMTLSDVGNVIFEHKVLTNRTAIEQAEARNHQATLHWLIEQLVEQGNTFVINEQLILNIHLRLMNGIIGDAGRYRMHSVRIVGANVSLANYIKIPTLINKLVHEMNENSTNVIIETLAQTHAEFEKIHPFSDGNGRTGRLLLLVQALRAGITPPLILKERKYAYYKYLEAAQMHEKYLPLELFIADSIISTHDLLSQRR